MIVNIIQKLCEEVKWNNGNQTMVKLINYVIGVLVR